MKKFLIIFTLLLISMKPVSASQWVPLGVGLFLDKSSVQYCQEHRTYKAWVKEIKKGKTKLSYNEYNLRNSMWRNLDIVNLDAKNEIKKRIVNNYVGLTWVNVVPDTNSSLEYSAIKKQVSVPILDPIPDEYQPCSLNYKHYTYKTAK